MFVQIERRPRSTSLTTNYIDISRVNVEQNERSGAAHVYMPLVEVFHGIATVLTLVADLSSAYKTYGGFFWHTCAKLTPFVEIVAE